MSKISVPRTVATILVAIAAIACDKTTPFDTTTPFDGMMPLIEGTIKSRTPDSMWVVDDFGVRTGDYCGDHSFNLRVGSDLMVFHNGFRTGTSELTVGRRVSVFGSLDATKQCPGSGSASGVFLH